MSLQKIQEKIQKSHPADFGTVFNQSIDLFKETWAQGLIMFVILFALIFGIQFLLAMPLIVLVTSSKYMDVSSLDSFHLFIGIMIIVFVFFFLAAIITIANGLLGGLYLIYKKADYNEFYSTNDLFFLLKGNKIFKTFKVSVLQLLVILVSYLLCIFPIIYSAIPISYIIVIYAFNPELSAKQIVTLAFKIGNKNWAQTFLLRIVTTLVSFVGLFICGIGFFATFAIVLIPLYYVYKHAVGFENENEINAIGLSDDI
jgi:hypothetical protein